MKRALIPIVVSLVLATPVLAQQRMPEPPGAGPNAGTVSDLATGVDLKGPPKFFVGRETPE